jgi:hypothetical protein
MLIILSFNLFQCIQVKQTTKDFETAWHYRFISFTG